MGPSSNNNQFFGVKISSQGIPVQNASDKQLIYKSNFSTNLFNGPDGVWKVMEGTRQANSFNGLKANQFGFWVAENGVDVQKATDSQMIFNSNTVNLNIVASGSVHTDGFSVNAASTNTWYGGAGNEALFAPEDSNGNFLPAGKPYGLFSFFTPDGSGSSLPVPGPGTTSGVTFGFSFMNIQMSGAVFFSGVLLLTFSTTVNIFSGATTGTQAFPSGTFTYYVVLPGLPTS